MTDFIGDAGFSPDRVYRWWLERRFAPVGPRHLWIMLNPSTADAETNDPTVERCCRRSIAMGAASLSVVNLYALRSTDPAALRAHAEPVGWGNEDAIRFEMTQADLVIGGWGEHAKPERVEAVRDLARSLGVTIHALAENASGNPRHPLYVAYSATPKPWSRR